MTAHNVLQPIPVIGDAAPDVVSAVIAALDAHLALATALTYHPSFALLPDAPQFAEVRHAVLLWASAHGFLRVDDDETIVIVRRDSRGRTERFCALHVPEDFEEPRAQVDAEQMWQPSDEGRP